METILFAAVDTSIRLHRLEVCINVLCVETVLRTAVDTASYQHKIEACTIVGRSLLPATLKM